MSGGGRDDHEAVREEIAALLSGGLATDWQTRADDDERVRFVTRELRSSDGSLPAKLRIAGFTDHPIEHEGMEQACERPGLDLPVRPEWSCNVWRV
jgi:hypothetical protein